MQFIITTIAVFTFGLSPQHPSLTAPDKDTHCLSLCVCVGWAAGRASDLLKTEWWGAGVVICLEQGADLHVAQLMPLSLTVSSFRKIQICFTFLVPAHPGQSRT